jgi:outer membrane protein assembly factor BamB
MVCCPYLRWFLTATSVLVAATALFFVATRDSPAPAADQTASSPKSEEPRPGPMFGGTVHRNMANPFEKNIPADWSVQEGKQKNIKWVSKLSTKAYGGPVIAGGKIFVATDNRSPHDPKITGDKGIVLCLRENDGAFLWEAVHEELPDEIVKEARVEGIASTPTVEGNRVYYVSNRCEVICADTEGFLDGKNDGVQDEEYKGPANADIIWRLDMIKELNVFPHKLPNCSPLVVGDLLFVTTGNGADGEGGDARPTHPEAPSFIAVNKHTGKVVWQDNSPGDKIILGQWSNPTYAVVNGKPQVIFGGGDGWLRAFEPATGKPIWKFDCNPKAGDAKNKGARNYIVATPVVYDNKVYVGVGQEPSLGSGVGHLWCIDLTKTGDVSPVDDNFDPKAAVNKNSALVWHFGGTAQGQSDRDYAFGRTLSTCAIHDNLLYISELAGYVYCIDAQTGQKYWDHDLKAEVWGSPYYVDGKVFVGTGDGDVHVFAHGKEKKVLGKIEMEDAINSTPVACNGVLYVMTMKNLYAISSQK